MCPRCKSAEIGRSQRWKFRDLFMMLWGMRAYRCRECRKRFYLPSNWEGKIRAEQAWREDVTAQEAGERPPRRNRRS